MSYPVMSTSVPWSLVKSGFRKTPHFNSVVQATAAGRGSSSLALQPYPTWDFTVDLDYVQGGESVQFSVLSQFLGCFMACCGRGGLFLFTDPIDNTVDDTGLSTPQSCLLNVTAGAANPMGQTGDGSSTQFQLARRIDQGVDILQQVSGVAVYVNGALTSAYTLSPTGLVTFSTPPANGAALTWSGSFQYLCQFSDDTLKDLARVSKNSQGFLWSCGSIAFESRFV
jgi:hypothetical protein